MLKTKVWLSPGPQDDDRRKPLDPVDYYLLVADPCSDQTQLGPLTRHGTRGHFHYIRTAQPKTQMRERDVLTHSGEVNRFEEVTRTGGTGSVAVQG
jgi:hypothetical protein